MNKSYEQNISESNYSRPESTYTDILNQAIDNHGFNAPCIKAKLENYEKAIESYKKAQEIYPTMRSPKIMIKQIKELIKQNLI